MNALTNTLTVEMKNKWLSALRSGEFNQGYEHLISSDSNGQPAYCCLGVLNETCSLGYSGYLAWIGCETANIVDDPELFDIIPMHIQKELSEMNDSGTYNFNQIADHIEKNVKASDETT